MGNGVWQVWIDTGGTFTDCIAIDPRGGSVHRVKALSSGIVPVRIVELCGDDALRIERPWDTPADFFTGFDCRAAHDSVGSTVRIVADDGSGFLRISGGFPGEIRPGSILLLTSGEGAPLLAARIVTATPLGAKLPPIDMRLATTLATNALLERRGGRVAFFITRGFCDLLLIGDQTRPDLFSLTARRPPPLYERVVEVDERLNAEGAILAPLDEAALRTRALEARQAGLEIAALALLHAHVNPEHEKRAEEILREIGFTHISRSSALAPFIKILHRAETAVANAFVAPVMEEHVARVRGGLANGGGSRVRLLTSAGGVIDAAVALPKDCLLSGPAGGVVGAVRAGAASGFDHIIGFDMGGTSTDVCRHGGQFEYRFEQRVGDARIMSPALAIETVAAGGGSICGWRHGRLVVGPESAGAHPGPACYGRGGPLTITDVNLLLGRLDPARFEIPINSAESERAFGEVLRVVSAEVEKPPSREELLEGLLAIADERMADAIARVSSRRGFDPREHALVAFGGAGGQHACRVAERLGIAAVVFPRDASLLSALGVGFARIERFAETQLMRRLDALRGDFLRILRDLEKEAIESVAGQGERRSSVEVTRRIASVRVEGQDARLEIDFAHFDEIEARFGRAYRNRYGHEPSLTAEKGIEIESLRVIASAPANAAGGLASREGGGAPAVSAQREMRRCFMGGRWIDTPHIERSAIKSGTKIAGPAVIVERSTTIVIEDGWRGGMDDSGAIVVRREHSRHARPPQRVNCGGHPEDAPGVADGLDSRRSSPAKAGGDDGRMHVSDGRMHVSDKSIPLTPGPSPEGRGEFEPSPEGRGEPSIIERDLFAARFTAIAEQMGEMLERTATSTNVKERRDFSCALLDSDGVLLVNAPHIPVHLGSLGICVRAVRDIIVMETGDVVVTNHPAFGGSHLPDVTIITPAFDEGGRLLGYAASRAHHAEMGGTRPGSMPPDARTLEEEGVVIPPTHLVRRGQARYDEMSGLLRGARHPSRAVADNLADMRAQVAANQAGVEGLRGLAALHGVERLRERMAGLRDHAAGLAARAIAGLPVASCAAADAMDDGSPICVRIEKQGAQLHVDFAGSGAVHPGNLNATPAIVHSAVMYILRLLIGEALPLNEGIMRQVSLNIPRGMLNPDFPEDPPLCPAVVGGNTEVSQRIVDVLLRALGLAAASQGTMNNVLFGNDTMGYYETVCGGGGAGPGFAGASAIQCHMTNTRITDPEILEKRYPIRLERFEIRPGSGGDGLHRGGDGVIREMTFLAPLTLSVLTQRRTMQPFGLAGGRSGQPGKQTVLRADGSIILLSSIDGCDVSEGDRLILETPGGGGFGEKWR